MFGWFSKKAPAAPPLPGYDFISVDMHSHVLPGIDDGAQTVEDSAVLIQRMKDMGIQKIIATPHIMADLYRNTPDTIQDALQRLRTHLAEIKLDMPIEAAAEHYYDEYFMQLIEKDQLMLIKDKYVLFELSFANKPPNVIGVIQKLTNKGLVPILAHPERYPYLTPPEVARFREWGCLIQLNTISLTGYYGKPAKVSAEALIDGGLIDLISSDMHHEKHAQALQDALKIPHLQQLAERRVLRNTELL